MKGKSGYQKEFDEKDDPISIEITDTLVHKQVIRLLLVAAEKSFKPPEYVSKGSILTKDIIIVMIIMSL